MEDHRRKRKRRQLDEKEVKSSAASKITFMSNVSEDLVNEILIRLPDFKSAILCSSVCKSWFSLVTHKTFIKSFNRHHYSSREHSNYSMRFTFLFRWHNKHHPFPKFLSLTIPQNRDSPIKEISCLDFLPFRRSRLSVHASCDGFLLLSLTKTDFCVCHPLTKQWRFLPPPPKKIKLPEVSCGLVLARPNDCTNNISFKIVFVKTRNNQRLRATVFCSESRLWTNSLMLFPRPVDCINNMASVACNGVVYWLEGNAGCKGIIAFDPNFETAAAGERWRYIELPGGFGGGWRAYAANVRLGMVRGRLRLSQMFLIKKDGYHMSLKVWELNDEEWSLVHNVRPRFHNAAVLMGFHPDDGDVMFLGYDGFHVCRYDIGGDTLEKVGHLPIDDKYRVSVTRFFLQTLIVVHPSWWPKLISRMKEKKKKKRNKINTETRAEKKREKQQHV